MNRFFQTLLLVVTCINFTFGQMADQSKITGVYYFSSGNPEGGTSLIVFPENTFVIAYFGNMISGSWELKGQVVYFHPNIEKAPFVLYARKNDTLKNTRVLFKGFDRGNPAYINSSPSEKGMQPVFNEDANCFSPPYVYESKEKLINLSAALADNYIPDGEFELITFDTLGVFNDFILYKNSKQDNIKDFTVQIQNDSLEFSFFDKKVSKRDLSTLNDEESRYLKDFVKLKPYEDVVFVNSEGYVTESMVKFFLDKFTYDKLEDVYIINEEAEGYDKTEYKLIPYRRIQTGNVESGSISILKNSLFTATCDE